MSWGALGWAAKQRPGKIADKLVLIALADRHNEEQDIAWPSIKWLCEFTGADRKTIITSLTRLETLGLIADSGQRFGKTKQVKGYMLAINSAEKGIPKTEPLPDNGTAFPAKESQKRDTEPVKEPKKKKDKPFSSARELSDDWEPEPFGLGTKSRGIVDGWPPGELEHQLEHFRAHHGKKADRFADWQKAWSTWVLNNRNFGNGRKHHDNQSGGRTVNAAASVIARLAGDGIPPSAGRCPPGGHGNRDPDAHALPGSVLAIGHDAGRP